MTIKKHKFVSPKKIAKRKRRPSIVEDAIAAANKKWGSKAEPDDPAELRIRLQEVSGERIDPQKVYGWRQRGNFPRNWVPFVSIVTGIPLETMVQYKSALYEE